MTNQNRSLKKDKSFTQDLSAGALSYTSDYGRRTKIEQIGAKSTVAITETVTVTLVSALGAAYNQLLDEYDLVSETDYIFRPQGNLNLQAGDEVKIECTNANTTGVFSGSIKSSEVLR